MIKYLLGTFVGLLISIITVWLEPRLRKYKITVGIGVILSAITFAFVFEKKSSSQENIKSKEEKIDIPKQNKIVQVINLKKDSLASSIDSSLLYYRNLTSKNDTSTFINPSSSLIENQCKIMASTNPKSFVFKKKMSNDYIRNLKNIYNTHSKENDIICVILNKNFPIALVCSDGLRLFYRNMPIILHWRELNYEVSIGKKDNDVNAIQLFTNFTNDTPIELVTNDGNLTSLELMIFIQEISRFQINK